MSNELVIWIAACINGIIAIIFIQRYRKWKLIARGFGRKVEFLYQEQVFKSAMWTIYDEKFPQWMPGEGQEIVLLIGKQIRTVTQCEKDKDVTTFGPTSFMFTNEERKRPRYWMPVETWCKMFIDQQ